MSDVSPPMLRSHGRFLRLFVGISASLALVVGLAVGFGAVRLVQLRNLNTDRTWVPPVPTGASASPQPDSPGGCADRACNYLILGSDSRANLSEQEQQEHFGTMEDIGGVSRADTIMLVHTDPDLQKAIILSFPRDLWVQIPDKGWNKINSAFEGGAQGGGPQEMANTVSNLTGMRIDHYLYVDLAGFREIVDTLGGVEMCPPAYLADPETGMIFDWWTGLNVAPGCQTFDGETALAFVRSRHLPCDNIPDFSRIGRQQQFLRAVINQMLRPQQIVRAPTLVEPILGNMRRDRGLKPTELAYLVGQLRGITTGAAEFRAVPGVPGWEGGLAVVYMDPSAETLFRAVREGMPISDIGLQLGSTEISPANITVAVIDDASAGAAAQVEDLLSTTGFDVSPGIWDASRVPKGVKGATVVFRPGNDAMAQVLTRYLPGTKVLESAGLKGVPVAVVVPAGWEPAEPTNGSPAAQCPEA